MLTRIALLGSIALAAQAPPARTLFKEGSYLRSSYVDTLRTTKSPHKSFGPGGVMELLISTSPTGATILPIVDFHDSGIEYVVDSAGLAKRSDNQFPKESFQVAAVGDSSIHVSTPGSFKGTYTFVGDKEVFLRGQTIAGVYHDNRGRRFEFRSDGHAITPEKAFEYKVGCDHFEAPFDYLYGDSVYWAFRVRGDTLELFTCSQDGPTVRAPKPFLVLHRIKG